MSDLPQISEAEFEAFYPIAAWDQIDGRRHLLSI